MNKKNFKSNTKALEYKKKCVLTGKKAVWNGGTLTAPLPPTLVSCGTLDKPNILTVAWTGILSTKPPKTYVSIRPERYSYGIIKDSGEFVINLTTAELIKATDFCGVKSGRNTDKFSICNLHPTPSSKISAPTLLESPLSLECKVADIVALGSHDMFIADIVAVQVDEGLIQNGKLHLERANLLAFAHGEYYELGKRLGSFGYSVRKKNKK